MAQVRVKSASAWLRKESTAGIICTLPFSLGFLLFIVVPMALSLYYAFTNFNVLSAPKWIGFENFIKMFTADEKFLTSLRVTSFYTFVSVPLRLVFALLVALLLVHPSRLTSVYRAFFYLPSIIGSSVAVAVLWKRMWASQGTINSLLGSIGIETNFSWLGNTNTAIWMLILLSVWQFGSSMLIFLSSLKQIPVTYYEAAKVDGAGNLRRFFRITLPLLTPTIFFNLVMQTINGFLAFTQCFIITEGKPLNSTLFYTVYMYFQSFKYSRMGYGAAMAWVMLLLVGLVTLLLFWTKKFWVYSEGDE